MAKPRHDRRIAARALAFLVLTAARTEEVLAAPWSEIDLDKRLWTIPVARLKMRRMEGEVQAVSKTSSRRGIATEVESPGHWLKDTPCRGA